MRTTHDNPVDFFYPNRLMLEMAYTSQPNWDPRFPITFPRGRRLPIIRAKLAPSGVGLQSNPIGDKPRRHAVRRQGNFVLILRSARRNGARLILMHRKDNI